MGLPKDEITSISPVKAKIPSVSGVLVAFLLLITVDYLGPRYITFWKNDKEEKKESNEIAMEIPVGTPDLGPSVLSETDEASESTESSEVAMCVQTTGQLSELAMCVQTTSSTRQLLYTPIELNHSSNMTPLVVTTGPGNQSDYLMKLRDLTGGGKTLFSVEKDGDVDVKGDLDLANGITLHAFNFDPDSSYVNDNEGLLYTKDGGDHLYFLGSNGERHKISGDKFWEDNSSGVYLSGATRLGIGTESPGEELSVRGQILVDALYGGSGQTTVTNGADIQVISGNSNAILRLTPDNGDVQDTYSAYITGNYNDSALRVGVDSYDLIKSQGYNTPEKLHLLTYSSGDGDSLERLTIDGSGLVGIGTTSPSSVLDVYSSSREFLANFGSERDRVGITIEGSSGIQFIINKDGVLSIGSANTTSTRNLTIANNAVGIGTLNPTERLHIGGDTIRIEDPKTPASSGDSCDIGEITWDADYIYVCTSSDNWERASISTW